MSRRSTGIRPAAALAGVVAGAAVIYLLRLGSAPVNISSDEARFGVQAYSIVTTGRAVNGSRLPLFFNITNPLTPGQHTAAWWQPTLFYLIAGVLRVAPISEWSIRLPTVILGLLNLYLVFEVGRRVFASAWYGVLASMVLALTPAHFLFARQAMDYFVPLPFALAWLWLLQVCLETERRWCPLILGALLGVGLYSYITSWVVMPAYAAVTLIVLRRAHKPARAGLMVAGAFALLLVPAAAWVILHPEMLREVAANYEVATGPKLVERLDAYWSYFSPSYLFFSGGSNPMFATRQAGVLLLATAVLIPCGIWTLTARPSLMGYVLLFGFCFAAAPIALALPPDPNHFTPRHLLILPYATLISIAGLKWLIERRRAARAVALILMASVPLQFAHFAWDYFGRYQRASAYRFDDMNLRAVASQVADEDASAHLPAVYLSSDMGEHKAVQWKFHLLAFRRSDLWERTAYAGKEPCRSSEESPGSLLLLYAGDHRVADLVGGQGCSLLTTVNHLSGQPATTILRVN